MNVDDDWNEAVYGQLLDLNWSDVVNIQKINKPSWISKLKIIQVWVRRMLLKFISKSFGTDIK